MPLRPPSRLDVDDRPAEQHPATVEPAVLGPAGHERPARSGGTTGEAPARLLPGAEVAPSARLGRGTTVWPLAQIREDAVVGSGCVVGRGAYVGPGVVVGDRCKLQNQALVYEPAILADGVFVGPGAVLTNDQHPRSITPDGRLKTAADWDAVGVSVGPGASIGARAVCVAPVRLGAWCLVAAGAVVVHDVADFALVAGTPARQIGWVGRAGVRLARVGTTRWRCPQTGEAYKESDGRLRLSSPP